MSEKIDLRDIKLHWGLSELTSRRWREQYLLAPPSLLPTVRRLQQTLPGRGVESLSVSEQAEIIAVVSWFRHPLFMRYLYGAKGYAIRGTPLEVLMRVTLMREMWGAAGPSSLAQYARSKPPDDAPDEPRNTARSLIASPPTQPFGYPIVGYDRGLGQPVLIDGFARCVGLVLRHDMGSTDATVPVMYCDP